MRLIARPARQRIVGGRAAPSHLLALEPRMMFDGAAVATAADVADHTQSADAFDRTEAAMPQPVHFVPDHRGEDLTGSSLDGVSALAVDVAPFERQVRNEIIFIDRGVADYMTLAEQWADRGLVILIDTDRDGIDQMREALVGMTGIAAIHIVSHGSEGAFDLGATRIDAAAINGELMASFAAIGAKLSADGDILIYGCDFGEGERGQAAMAALARVTGADVAASTDDTGAADLGGNWQLEVASGVVQSSILASDRWNGLLARSNSGAWTINGATSTTTIDGVTVTITFTDAGTSSFTGTSNQSFNTIAAFDNGAQGQASLGTTWMSNTATDVGMITISFSQAVVNPVINLDRLGGTSGTTSNSALLTLLTSGATLTKLAGPAHFVVDSTARTVTRQINATTTTNGESSLTGALGTAAGSVRIGGTFTSLQFSIQMTGTPAGGDGFEIGAAIDASPTARNDAFTQNEDFGSFSGNLLSNNGNGADSDPRGDTLTVTSARNSAGTAITIGSATTLPSGAGVTVNANGTFTYRGNGIDNSLAVGQTRTETINYTIADANGGTSSASATITITGVNDAPVAVNDTATTFEDTAVTVTVLANDSDVDRDSLTVTSATAANGTVTINANGSLTYNPNVNFAGADTISYAISDGRGGTATATVAMTVNAVDDPPVNTVPGAQTVGEDMTIVFSTANGNAISVADVENAAQTVTLSVTNGTLTLGSLAGLTFTQGDGTADATMTFSGTIAAINQALQGTGYAPTADYNGPAQITLRTATGAVPVTSFVNGGFELNNFPDTNNFRIVDESQVPGWDTDATDNKIEVWDSGFQNVTAYEGDQFVEINANQVGALFQNFQSEAGTGVGVQFAHRGRTGVDVMRVVATDLGADGLTGTADDTILFSENFSDNNTAWGVYTRQLTTSATGNIIRFEFRSVSSAGGSPSFGNFIDGVSVTQSLSDVDTIAITVTPVVDIADDSATTAEDTAVTLNVLANDSFENAGRAITAVNGVTITAGGAAVAVANGAVSLNASGQLSFKPAANYNGTTSFTYTAGSNGTTETATATVVVTPVNDAPVPVGSLPARTNVDAAAVSVATAGGFSDVDNATLTYAATGFQPA